VGLPPILKIKVDLIWVSEDRWDPST